MGDFRKFFVLFFTLPFVLSFDCRGSICEKVDRSNVIRSLGLNGFKCVTKTVKDCSFSQCEGKIGDYTQPVFITVPQEIDSLGLHFHGWILGTLTSKPYDVPIPEMIKKFDMESSLCQSKQLTVFPSSRGANADYKAYFQNSLKYNRFMDDIHKTLGEGLRNVPLHLSGHSGGGKYVAGTLNAGINVAGVSVYDGIYSDDTKTTLATWHHKTDGKLTIVTVKGMPPETFVAKKFDGLRAMLRVPETGSNLKINGVNYEVINVKNFTHFSRYSHPVTPDQAHFDVVNDIWSRDLKSR